MGNYKFGDDTYISHSNNEIEMYTENTNYAYKIKYLFILIKISISHLSKRNLFWISYLFYLYFKDILNSLKDAGRQVFNKKRG